MTRRAIVQKWILYCLCALVLLAVATILTKKPPATYGMKPKGEIIGGAAAVQDRT